MSGRLYNETRGHTIQIQENQGNRNNRDNEEIRKEPDKMNPEDLPDYIQPFTHLFNKKKFKKLLERREWDHEINLTDEVPKGIKCKGLHNDA